jgi:uncharacterized protein YjbI with pentapeptide repeats
MVSLFKSVFHGGKTAVLNPPPDVRSKPHVEPLAEVHGEVPAGLSLAPPKSSDANAVAPAIARVAASSTTPAIEPAPNDEAVLQDFLLKNFLLDEQSPQTATPEPPPVYAQTATAEPEPPPVYPRIPDPLPELSSNANVIPEAIPEATPEAHADASPHADSVFSSDANAHANAGIGPIAMTLIEPEEEVVTAPELNAAHTKPRSPKVDSSEWALEETLANHKEWLDSHGATGGKADLQNVQFEDRELIGVNLRYADLQDANLKSADLLLADLRDACLVRANLQESCLVGVNMEGANLEGAALESAMGLLPRQLAGANLHEASLPGTILEFNALAEFQRTATTAARLFGTTLVVSLLSCLTIWKTKDVQLLTDSAIIPYLHSSAAAAAAPTDEIYLIAPAALLAIYLWFLYNLQRVWDAVLELPAVFPDGRVLGQKGPRIVTGLLRNHFRWMNPDAPSTRLIEKSISVLLAYWMVPLVLLFFWARYLTLQEMHGTILQEALILIGVAAALYCTTSTGRPGERWVEQGKPESPVVARLKGLKPATVLIALFAILSFFSIGTIAGVPHSQLRAPQYAPASIRRWAPSLLWLVGYDPYAELTEASISLRPPNWSGTDDQISEVSGARLNGTNFRYAQAYGVFLAGAHLFRANFQGAFMSEADFRGADLGQANLKFAVLDRAQMNHANLDRASLDGANLTRVDLRGANLSYSSLANAELLDARLDGVSFYGAHAQNASLVRGNLEKADMREAHLEGANLDSADLQQAYMWSSKLSGAHLQNAQLATAIFINADLQGADLRGAHFNGTVLNGANLQDTNLDGADLRGALQLSAYQVCSAKSHRSATLDDTLQAQVDAQCGSASTPHQP